VEQHPKMNFHVTPTQKKILQLCAEGHRAKEIAHLLRRSRRTIEEHLIQTRKTVGARTLPHLIALAAQCGVLQEISPSTRKI
jgi:DNA-binding CsgD family transcriptional regulator